MTRRKDCYYGKKGKVVLSVVMSGALILSGTGIQADAKAKSSVSLNKTKISLKRGKKYTLKIKKRGDEKDQEHTVYHF